MKETVNSVTYWLDREYFKKDLRLFGKDKDFTGSWVHHRCIEHVVILIEYIDQDKGIELVQFDMCRALK